MAGGGPRNVLLVVNDQSLESLELGQYYRALRGIPEINVCHISVPPCVAGLSGSYSIAVTNFEAQIRTPVLQHISKHALTNQIDYIVFSRDIPYKVNNSNGITSAMFYDYKTSPPAPMDSNTENYYYGAERSFSRLETTNNYYLSMMLTSYTLDEAKALASRGAASDTVSPTGTVYLLKSNDPLRNIRYLRFDAVEFLGRFMTNSVTITNLDASVITGMTDVVGYLAGVSFVPDIQSNTFLPGAYGDHLTSFGGEIFEDSGQTPILDFIDAGACGSYGTVTEPYSIAQKFPDPMSYFLYERGFNLAESYWMSVENPYNGLFVGEPLASPYAVRPLVGISSPATNQIVSGTASIVARAMSGHHDKPVAQLDLFVDDVFVCTMTNVLPCAGNRVSATIGGKTATYNVATNNTLYDVASGLQSNINASNGMPVSAVASGDRIMLAYTNYGHYGSNLTYSVNCTTGTAGVLTLFATNLSGNLLESVYPARELLMCYLNPPDAGDMFKLIITLQNGIAVTNQVAATNNDTADAMLSRLSDAVNSNSMLQGTNGVLATDYTVDPGYDAELWLQARQPGPEGYNIHVTLNIVSAWPVSGLNTTTAFSDNMNDNEGDLTAHGNVLVACGLTNLNSTYALSTASMPNGQHTLGVVAYEGTALRTQGYAELPVIVSNGTLTCSLLSPSNGQAFFLGDSVSSTAEVSGVIGSVTQVVLIVEEKALATITNAPFSFNWQTLKYGSGTVGVRAEAWDSSGAFAISPEVQISVLATNDADHDGLPDAWERTYFGSIYAYSGTDDPDGDGVNNLDEYIANTDPTHSNSYFRILSITNEPGSSNINLSFVSSTGRLYNVLTKDYTLTGTNGWISSSGPLFWGTEGQYIWTDSGSSNTLPPLQVSNRFYRVSVQLP